MGILDHLKPLKLEQHGTQQAAVARDLLQNRGSTLSQPDRDMADGLLVSLVALQVPCADTAV
jgi:hypothetical protein